MSQNQRALSEIIEKQGGEDEGKPRNANRPTPEVTHIRIQRFGPRHCQHHRTEKNECSKPMRDEELDSIPWVHCLQYFRRNCNLCNAKQSDRREPHSHDGTEDPADFRRPFLLDHEEADENPNSDWHYQYFQRRCRDLEAFDRTEHRNRRRDDTVAIKERGADQAENDDVATNPVVLLPAGVLEDQREQGENPTFTAVVCAQNEDDVLDADYESQRPEYE